MNDKYINKPLILLFISRNLIITQILIVFTNMDSIQSNITINQFCPKNPKIHVGKKQTIFIFIKTLRFIKNDYTKLRLNKCLTQKL